MKISTKSDISGLSAHKIAIIGAGPAGFFSAAQLLRDAPGSIRIDILDQLWAPFGLLRYGVAPDHLITRKPALLFQRILEDERVRFFGNVQLGRDVSLEQLKERYDALVICTGCERGRNLGIPGESAANIFRSDQFVGWYNGHPNYSACRPDLDVETALILGNGNVAIDAARMLLRTEEELLRESDTPLAVIRELKSSNIRRIVIVGRREEEDQRFSDKMLRELKEQVGRRDACPTLEFRYLRSPQRFEADAQGQVTSIDLQINRIAVSDGQRNAHPSGESETLDCGLVISALGYQAAPLTDLPQDPSRGILAHSGGQVLGHKNIYTAGWAKRGPQGLIGNNKPDALESIKTLLANLTPPIPAKEDITDLLKARAIRYISKEDWARIDAEEIRRGSTTGRCREKFVGLDAVLGFLA